jgi:hypothetical protein
LGSLKRNEKTLALYLEFASIYILYGALADLSMSVECQPSYRQRIEEIPHAEARRTQRAFVPNKTKKLRKVTVTIF